MFTGVKHLFSFGEVQRAEVERSSGIMLEHLVDVGTGDGLGSVCQIMDVYVLAFSLDALLEIIQDLGHVFPGFELADKDVQECLLHVLHLSDTQCIVEICNDSDACWWNEQDICKVLDFCVDGGTEVARDESQPLRRDIKGGVVVGKST